MWLPKNIVNRHGGNGLVAVAIDKDKGSQNALKWTIDNLLQKGQTLHLIHVKLRSPLPTSHLSSRANSMVDSDAGARDLFLPFRCYCTRKDIQCKDIILEDVDVAKGLIEYLSLTAIDNLVIGASGKSGFLRFKAQDIPSSVVKGAPDFCNIYVIAKGKLQSVRTAIRSAPARSPLRNNLPSPVNNTIPESPRSYTSRTPNPRGAAARKPPPELPQISHEETEFRSPFTRKGYNTKSYGEIPLKDSDISIVSSGRPSIDRMFPSYYESQDSSKASAKVSSSLELDIDESFESMQFGRRSIDIVYPSDFSSISQESDRSSTSPQAIDDVEAEMRRLKLELKQTMEMYSTACKEALTAKQKAMELQKWKLEEERKLGEARQAEEAALAIADKEKAKSRAAIEAAEAAKRIAELESQKRITAEKKALKESEEKKKALHALAQTDGRCRKYSIEEIEAATEFFSESRKIGEGGYGPVFKCNLDHTPVAIKVLRPDAAQGRSQFQKEVEVLSCIRHPNMVLLLGACPEYGCLVYEYMANGSLEDCLFRKRNMPPLSWQLRFRIAAEIGTSLLFLHQAKPEPLVHRDLKPANILLDNNFVSKISDVGLARLVPPSVTDTATQYRMTSTAGTFCYIDPEYQQTGMLGVKSDIYSLGIMFLQMITARPPMGLTHHMERAIERGTFADMLDPVVSDWPIEEALLFAKLALQCSELRRKDRPDLGKSVLPELNRLREFAESSMNATMMSSATSCTQNHSQVSLQLGATSDSLPPQSSASSRNPSMCN